VCSSDLESPDTTSRIRQDLAAALALAGDNAAAQALLARDLSPAQVAEALSGYQQLRRTTAGTD
jgi:Flp pilus assembly protein TadD